MVAPALLYHLAEPHFAAKSLWPLAISGCPPILWLAYGAITLKAADFLGLFAAENVVVRICALLLAHSEQGALIGRSLENVILAAIFLISFAFAKPLMFYMARQLSTGNDPAQRQAFEISADQPNTLRVYRALTWTWAFGLLIKAAGAYGLAMHVATQDFLVFSPLWDLASDCVLVTGSILYARAHLAPREAASAKSPEAPAMPRQAVL
jgi:hypothetical protein